MHKSSGLFISWLLFFIGHPVLSQSIIPDTCRSPEFNLQPGFYNSPVSVTLTSKTPDSHIFYSLNGADPTEQSTEYSSPIPVDQTVTIRARCFSTGLVPGDITTGTFLINENTTLPVISLATDPYNLFDPKYGIFVYWEPYYESNLFQDWERPVHVEFFEADGNPAFSLDAGVKVHGGLTRAQSQKALNIYARKIYGVSKINYRLFQDRVAGSYDSFVLRNGGNDFKWTLFRDEMMHSIVADVMDLEQAAARPAIVFLNGKYYGIMHIREKISDNFIEANTNISGKKIDMLEYVPYTSEVKVLNGSVGAYAQLTDFITTHDLSVDEYYQIVADQVDIQNFINYHVSQIYFDNSDWPGNNVKWWRPNEPVGRWRWILFDTDFGFGLSPFGNETGNQLLHYLHNTLLLATQSTGPAWPNPPYSNLLFRSLLKNQEFKNRFINTFCDHLNTTFQADRVKGLINKMQSVLETEIPRHNKKYPESAGHWKTDVEVLTTFAQERVSNVFSHLMTKFSLQRTLPLTLMVSDTTHGYIRINNLNLEAGGWTGRYFPRIPVTLAARPKAGFRFKNWSDGNAAPDRLLEVTAGMPAILANFEPAPDAGDHSVLINEINYRSATDFDTKDWVELYNNSSAAIDLGGWIFHDNSDEHSFVIPNFTILEPFSFLVICRNSTLFKILQPDVKNVTGDLDFKFSSSGDHLRLYNTRNELVDQVNYMPVFPWPDLSGKEGFTLELMHPDLDNSLAESWSISHDFTGSPGLRNSYMLSAPNETLAELSIRTYPNPFSRMLTIEFTTNGAESDPFKQVSAEIINLNGQIVCFLKEVDPGYLLHKFTWDGTDASGKEVPDGIYFCRTTGNRQHASCNQPLYQKIVLMRQN